LYCICKAEIFYNPSLLTVKTGKLGIIFLTASRIWQP
jgi:hypothetical protein